MAKIVTITIDGQNYQVPQGRESGRRGQTCTTSTFRFFVTIPRLEPVGMCRMCLVELGSVSVNRETGQPDLDANGQPVVRWNPKLQTACTQTVSEGMVVRTSVGQSGRRARRDSRIFADQPPA